MVTKNNTSLLLKKSGRKITKPRLLVLDFLLRAKKPASVKEIVKNIKGIDQVTVYRTLQALKQDNIVNQIDFQTDAAYFELKDEEKDHHHIICLECKKVKDFTGCDYKKLTADLLKNTRDFAVITSHSFELFGLCKACAK